MEQIGAKTPRQHPLHAGARLVAANAAHPRASYDRRRRTGHHTATCAKRKAACSQRQFANLIQSSVPLSAI
ncbi:hypothetical protein KCP78_13515 [Salmonella enterica subsp. enterica]|nr:hypothetical protein KCP78_13515 [Salmonella enterica subsp. enterica]